MDDKLLEVKDLSISFPTEAGVIRAVNEVSFEVPRRTTVGVVGESGCGKSVTARALLNIVQPPGRIDGGQVLFHDDAAAEPLDLLSMAPKGAAIRHFRGKRLAMIFQDPMTCLSPVHTVGNQIAESIRIHDRGVSPREARQRAVALLTEVGIPNPAGHLDSYSFELSGGMRQRALMAVALAAEPELLIADEPTTAIDVTIQAKFLDLIQRLQHERHMSILFITHDLGVIAEVSRVVVVMYLGRVVEIGRVEEIYERPLHPYTQLLFRSIPNESRSGGGWRKSTSARCTLTPSSCSDRSPTSTCRARRRWRRSGAWCRTRSRGRRACPFSDRCPSFVQGTCDAAVPPLYQVDEEHHARCFLYDDEAGG